jgi:hypothetical protein
MKKPQASGLGFYSKGELLLTSFSFLEQLS